MGSYRSLILVDFIQVDPVGIFVVLQHVEPETSGLVIVGALGVQKQLLHESFFVLGLDVDSDQQCNHKFLLKVIL